MKKIFAVLVLLMLICVFSIYTYLNNIKNQKKQLAEYNAEYEKYLNKEIYGTELITLINKVVDLNVKNKISKDENGYYINNNKNSVQIYLKMITIEQTYSMEAFHNDITRVYRKL